MKTHDMTWGYLLVVVAIVDTAHGSLPKAEYEDIDTEAFINAEPIHPVINPDAIAAEFAEIGGNNTARTIPGRFHFLNLTYGDAGIIMSPNYPKPYPSNADCLWILQSPEYSKISITFFDIHTQPWLFSFFDFVIVSRSGEFDDEERFAGDMNRITPLTMISSHNKFGIKFRTSNYLNYRGFKLIYQVQHFLKDQETSNVIVKDKVCGRSPCAEMNADELSPLTLATDEPSISSDRRETNGKFVDEQEVYPKVVGGGVTIPHAYPWMAAILIDGFSFCGGSLIDNRHILTAAHCTDKTVSHDIAVIRLPQAINFTNEVRPVCLPNRHHITETFENRTVRVTGWGKTLDTPGAVSPQLKHVEISVLPNFLCKQRYRSIVTGNLLCGKTGPKHSPCKGDSGGPLHVVEKSSDGERLMQIGIVSFGASTCENSEPVGFTRLTAFMDFIHRVIDT